MDRQQAVRRAWETFLETGRDPAGVSHALIASWRRSRHFGVGIERLTAPLAAEAELFRRRSALKDLLHATRPALQRSASLLAQASSMMILADPEGLIVETAGDERVLDGGRRNHLEVGGHWDEGAIGTNAIGTALADGHPVQVHGAEHFCEDVHRWTCAATPVHHPLDGTLLGVVDISGPAAFFNPQSLAFAVTLGQEIEATLGRAARAEHEILFQHFVSKRALWLSEEILIVDHRGILVHAAERARNRLDAAGPDALIRDLKAMIAGGDETSWERACRARFPNASLQTVTHEGAPIGCLIVLHQARGRPSPPAARLAAPKATVTFDHILGASAAIQEARERARKLAASDLPILVEGETGVGKELFARAIKASGATADGPFVPVNCGGIARDLIASELFGYVRGAFTGADENGAVGKIEMANGGVLCLDEIGEMPLDLQSYLLRVLEDGVVYRLGDREPRQVAIRIVSMTNRDLQGEVDAGRFRRDLYYRLAAVRLRIPPLRERAEDALLLAEHFTQGAAKRLGRTPPRISGEVAEAMLAYSWPGNVRELRNVMDAMVALSTGDALAQADLPPQIAALRGQPSVAEPPGTAPSPAALKAAERAAILAQVEACEGNLTKAAARLGLARSTLYLRLAAYGYRRPPS